MDVRNSRFHSPRAEARNRVPGSHGDRQILVPRQVPVGAQGLVEKKPANRERPWSQDCFNKLE